jgi:hypothetical protein
MRPSTSDTQTDLGGDRQHPPVPGSPTESTSSTCSSSSSSSSSHGASSCYDHVTNPADDVIVELTDDVSSGHESSGRDTMAVAGGPLPPARPPRRGRTAVDRYEPEIVRQLQSQGYSLQSMSDDTVDV